MKLQIMSDLHLDHPRSEDPPPLAAGADMVIVAGDTCQGLVKAIEHLRRAYLAPTEVVMLSGNHELWSGKLSAPLSTVSSPLRTVPFPHAATAGT